LGCFGGLAHLFDLKRNIVVRERKQTKRENIIPATGCRTAWKDLWYYELKSGIIGAEAGQHKPK